MDLFVAFVVLLEAKSHEGPGVAHVLHHQLARLSCVSPLDRLQDRLVLVHVLG